MKWVTFVINLDESPSGEEFWKFVKTIVILSDSEYAVVEKWIGKTNKKCESSQLLMEKKFCHS